MSYVLAWLLERVTVLRHSRNNTSTIRACSISEATVLQVQMIMYGRTRRCVIVSRQSLRMACFVVVPFVVWDVLVA